MSKALARGLKSVAVARDESVDNSFFTHCVAESYSLHVTIESHDCRTSDDYRGDLVI